MNNETKRGELATRTYTVRLYEDEYELIESIARSIGYMRSEAVRQALKHYAEHLGILDDRVLSHEDF